MMRSILPLLLSLGLFTSCVGTVQDTAQSFAKSNEVPVTRMDYTGIQYANAVSDSRIEVFFYPASGGSGRFTYDIIVGNATYPISVPSDILTPDYRGMLKYTLTGLERLTAYKIKIDVRDAATNVGSNTGIYKSATTFDNQVADFAGISSAFNMPGQDGKDSLKIRFIPARTSGGLTKQPYDPKEYEVVLVDAAKLTPNDMDITAYTSKEGRWVYSVLFDDKLNEYIVRGLPSSTKFYIRIRAIHDASIDDVYDPKKRSELNTNYISISTLSAELADIKFQPDSFQVTLAAGEQGLSAVQLNWTAAAGVFDHYRLYYGLEGGGIASGIYPAICLSPLPSPPSATSFCKKADFMTTSTPITGLKSYQIYEFRLVLCQTTACPDDRRIVSPVRILKIDPNSPSFNGIRGIDLAKSLEEVGSLHIKFDPPNLQTGYFDGLILKMRRTSDGSDTEVEITGATSPVFNDIYSFIDDTSIAVRGINYLDIAPYCFTLYPYKWDSDGVTRREMPDNVWKCVSPKAESPTATQFGGFSTATTERDRVTLNWETPSGGIYSHFELYWRKQAGEPFSWGDAIGQAGNSSNYTNYGKRNVASGNNSITLSGYADGQYIFGMITYFAYVTDDGTTVLRSETNGGLRRCIFNNASTDVTPCL